MLQDFDLILSDIDSTLTRTKSGDKYGISPRDFEPISQSLAFLRTNEMAKVIGITNQMGVMLKHKTFAECLEEQKFKFQLLPMVKSIYFCPNRGSKCFWISRDGRTGKVTGARGSEYYRKPNPGMLEMALLHHGFMDKKHRVVFLGDLDTDRQAAEAIGIQYIDITTIG